jgi:outer membrane immunogenic protein
MRKCVGIATALAGLLAMSIDARAADLPVAPAPVYVPPPFTFTGFYIGGNLGGTFNLDKWSESLFFMTFNRETAGGRFIGGGQVGFNYQFGPLVVGAEADGDWGANTQNAGNTAFIPAVGNIIILANHTWVSTAAARVGFAADHLLFYAKAGGGWAGSNGFTLSNTTTATTISGLGGGTNSGWLVGAGLEWAVTDHWTIKFEYDYVGLRTYSFGVPTTAPFLAGDTFTNARPNVQMAKVGVNYLFNWGGGY